MTRHQEIEAAKERLESAEYDDVRVFVEREDNSSTLEYSTTMQRDLLLLSAAFVEQHSQPVNQTLFDAAEQALLWIESDEATHGRQYGTGNALRAAIAAEEAEIAERKKPVTEEWLQSVGFMATFLPASENSQLALVVFDDKEMWPDGDVLLVCSSNGSWGFWERPIEENGEWVAFHNNFKKLKTRGNVIDLLRVLGGAT